MMNVIFKMKQTNVVVNVIWRWQMAKMASLDAEGYTDEDLEIIEILDSLIVD
jgi:hypothetical protein